MPEGVSAGGRCCWRSLRCSRGCDAWRPDGHLAAIEDFDGYQSEFAQIVFYLRTALYPDLVAKTL